MNKIFNKDLFRLEIVNDSMGLMNKDDITSAEKSIDFILSLIDDEFLYNYLYSLEHWSYYDSSDDRFPNSLILDMHSKFDSDRMSTLTIIFNLETKLAIYSINTSLPRDNLQGNIYLTIPDQQKKINSIIKLHIINLNYNMSPMLPLQNPSEEIYLSQHDKTVLEIME